MLQHVQQSYYSESYDYDLVNIDNANEIMAREQRPNMDTDRTDGTQTNCWYTTTSASAGITEACHSYN